MAQKTLAPEIIQKAQKLRKEGLSLISIAEQLGISQGSASNACRGIEKPARATVIKNRAPKSSGETVSTQTVVTTKGYTDETRQLANEVEQLRLAAQKARYQAELDAFEDRQQQRARLQELELRERQLRVELDEARAKAASGDTSVNDEIKELRGKLDDLREMRYRQDLGVRDAQIADLRRQIQALNSREPTAINEYGLMHSAMVSLTDELKTWHRDIVEVWLRKPPAPMSEAQRRELSAAIGEESRRVLGIELASCPRCGKDFEVELAKLKGVERPHGVCPNCGATISLAHIVAGHGSKTHTEAWLRRHK